MALADGRAGWREFMDNAPPAMPEMRLDYMVLTVRDIRKVRQWYEDVLGCRCTHAGRLAELETDFAVLEGPGFRLELKSSREAGTPATCLETVAEALERPGWRVLTLKCEDLAALDARLRHFGCDVEWYSRRVSPVYCSTLFRDCEGNLIAAVLV